MLKLHNMVIAVDPGFGGTGVCVFLDKLLYSCSNIKSLKNDTDRYVDISEQCEKFVGDCIDDLRRDGAYNFSYDYIKSVDIVIESPHAMGGVKGHASLAKGDVFKVAKLAGAIGFAIYRAVDWSTETLDMEAVRPKIHIYYPEVRAWKGQVSKETTKRRVLRDIRYFDVRNKLPSRCTEHIYDAAGIGLWFINKTIMGVL